jgi:4-amino-4-deoxy-L-arabinose transferase-like glycosyltransferase
MFQWLGLAALALLLLFPGTPRETGVTGQDEYSLTLRTPIEMLAADQYWTPLLNGEPRLRKPPLVYWAIAASYGLFGIELWAARLVGVLSGAALALAAAGLAGRLGSARPGLAGALVLACSGVAIEGRRAMLDLPLAAFVGLAVWAGALALGAGLPRGRQAAWATASGLALGLAALVKGPVALLFAASAALAAASSFPAARRRCLQPSFWLPALAALLLVALPWPISMRLLWPEFGAVLSAESGARRWSFLPIVSIGPVLGGLFGNCVPWSFLLLAGLVSAFRPGASPAARFFARWVLLGALPFLFFKSFERYLIPLVLPMAGLLAEELLRRPRPRGQLLAVTALLLLPTALFGALSWRFAGANPAPALALAALAVLAHCAWRGRSAAAVWAAAACLAAHLGLVYPTLGINRIPEGFERHGSGRPVFSFEGTQPAMLSMRLERSVMPLQSGAPATLDRALASPAIVYLDAVQLPNFEAAARERGADWRELERVPALYARKNWIKFARPGATRSDWLAAWRERSFEPIANQLVALECWPAALPGGGPAGGQDGGPGGER